MEGLERLGPVQYAIVIIVLTILTGVGKWLRDRFLAEQKARDAREKRTEERLDRQQKFLQELLVLARQDRLAQTELFTGMFEENIKSGQAQAKAVQKVGNAMDRTCKTQDARHSEIMATLKSMK